MDRFDEERDIARWLKGIARGHVLNERRKAGRRQRILSERLADILVANCWEDEEPVAEDTRQLLDAMRDCLQKLPQKSAQLLRERYQEDRRAPDLAESLRMSAVAVRQSLVRIRRAVRKCMDEQLGKTQA